MRADDIMYLVMYKRLAYGAWMGLRKPEKEEKKGNVKTCWTGKNVWVCALAACGFLVLPAQAEDMILSWKGAEKDPHPCLYVTAKDVAAAKAARKDLDALAAKTAFSGNMEEAIAAVLLTQNPAAEKEVIAGALRAMDGMIPVGLADAALATKTITAEERASLVGKIARACYMVNDPRYFSPDAPHASMCLNMYTTAAFYRLALAALIPSHPRAKVWFDGALAELQEQLDDWVDPQGGMAECPHYSMVIFDQWMGAFVIARNANAADFGQLFNPKLRKAAEWFGNISTPRDPVNNGARRLPSYGHTYFNESTCAFGMMATLWKGRDPAFAAHMEWLHREHGSFGAPGILSPYPAFMEYRSLFLQSGVEPKVPAWSSQYYQETGVQLRNVMGSDRETTLYMIAGRFHSHYYNDSGSIVIWGKGRELCGDDNYQFKRAKESRESHSMIDKPATYNEERVMALKEFSSAKDLDYVSGIRQGWKRQVAFVKDADPLAPNYFVVSDTVDAKSAPTMWRLYLSASEIMPTPNGVTAVGLDDVDMDIVFTRPAKVDVEIRSETLPPTPYSKDPIVVRHIAVPVEKAGTVTAVLYPRLKTEKPVEVMALDNGLGVKVVTPAGTDVVYLNPGPVKAELGGKAFEGKVGLLKERGVKVAMTAPGACDIPRTFWTDGDPQLRRIHWKNKLQYPPFPDYEEAVTPNGGNVLILDQQKPVSAGGFTATQPPSPPWTDKDQPGREATDVAVTWNDQVLDVTFTCADKGIVASVHDNDNIKLWKDDCVYVWLDPGHTHNDEKKCVMVQLSASGAWHDSTNGSPASNVEGLKTEVARTATGWTARLQIPWKGLGVSTPKPGDVWGVNFTRMDHPGKFDLKAMEMSAWAPLYFHPGDASDLMWLGHLVFTAKGEEAAVAVGREAMKKKHQSMVEKAYARETLVK